jgi:hypothetical protein
MMSFLTQQDVEELRSRGYDESNLYSTPSKVRVLQAKELINQVTETFRGVKLCRGVGLFEGQAIDDYDSEEQRLLKREKDEKDDWSRIESDHLNACYSSLSFFDPLGMRFHLPAFICCDLRGEYDFSLGFSLTELDEWRINIFSLLTPQEKAMVATYLEFLADDVETEFSQEDIRVALRDFWRRDASPI